MAAGGHFEIPKITFDRISRHFRSMHNFYLFFHKIQIYMFTYIMTIKNIETIYSQVVIFFIKIIHVHVMYMYMQNRQFNRIFSDFFKK